jgi:hypothetical protein
LEDFDADAKIYSVWETTAENIKFSTKERLCYYEMKKHKPWFDEGCSEISGQGRQAKLERFRIPVK